MELKLACQDLGTTCPFITRGETMEELTANTAKHAKEVHDYTDAQLNNPKMVENQIGGQARVTPSSESSEFMQNREGGEIF